MYLLRVFMAWRQRQVFLTRQAALQMDVIQHRQIIADLMKGRLLQ